MKMYVCNGKMEQCAGSTICRKPGGCWHTMDEFYALYDDHTDFELVYPKNDVPQYWEKIRKRGRTNE